MIRPPVRFLVLGDPVAHSLSPVMMTAALDVAGVEAEYGARRVTTSQWDDVLATLHEEGVAGCNVTVPHKERALASSCRITDAARAIGAVNTLVHAADGWEGDNTDGPGFRDWVEDLGDGSLLEREVLVLGAGGSARAVVWALLRAGCPHVRVANRTPERAITLARNLEEALDLPGRVASEALGGVAPAGGLVVNCTSLGLAPGDPAPLDAPALAPAARYLDLVYPDPPGTRLARAAGVPAADGRGLLVAQGARSLERWIGRDADKKAMRAAVDAAVRAR